LVITRIVTGYAALLFLYQQISSVMFKNDSKINNFIKNKSSSVIFLFAEQPTQSIKKCNHRNENGWCRKSNQICPLIKISINHQ